MTEESQNGAHGEDGLDIAARNVADALASVSAREDELRGAIELVHEERKRLTTALRALAPEHPLVERLSRAKPGSGKTTKSAQRVNPDTLDLIWETIKGREDAFTIPEIIRELDNQTSDDPVRRGIYYLRDHEIVRLAGRAKRPDGVGPPTQTFRVMDVDAAQAVLDENRESFAGPNGRTGRPTKASRG